MPNSEGKITLSPANTKIEFVGVHEGDKPDPRRGGFGKFTGSATMAGGTLGGIVVDIQTDSLTTEIDKLTDHLKSPDFFSVNDHPTAKFESTSIATGEGGTVMVKGNLTLLGTTKEVEFPAKVSFGDNGGLKLDADFMFDRTQYGMTFGEGKVKKDVQLIVKVGE